MINYLDNNFWKTLPELVIAPELDKLYTKDKSKNKKESSIIMWAIHLCESPESKFFHHPNKYSIIAEKVLKNKKFDWEKIENIKESYRNFVLTEAERSLAIWNETMALRNSSLKKMYQEAFEIKDTDELVKLDKMLSATSKMFDEYKKIKLDFEEEKTKKKGVKRNSLSDNDEI